MTRSMTRWTLAGGMALAAVGAVGAAFDVAPATADPAASVSSEVFDPVGDTTLGFHSPAFQDIVFGRMTKTASGDFKLRMEMAGPVPVIPLMPPPAHAVIAWKWNFDLDPTTSPLGYPGLPVTAFPAEFVVDIYWDGAEFACVAIDRRPLLAGGEATITPVSFNIDGTVLEAVLPSTLIGAVPPSFTWRLFTSDRSGVLRGGHTVDSAESVFNP
jgi:hypothetical protein